MPKSNSKSNKPMSLTSFLNFVSDNFILILIVLSFFLAGFFIGSLWQENKILKSNKVAIEEPQKPTQAAQGARDLSIAGLVKKGGSIGVDKNKLQKCIDSNEMAQKVNNDFKGGQKAGVTGTPGTVVIVNGKPAELITGALPYSDVKKIVDNYLKGGKINPDKQLKVANIPAINDTDHYKGNKNAKIVLVEYSDFECPFCQRFHPTMNQIIDEYSKDVAWVYRNYPLSFHKDAQKAAQAAECVAKLEGNDAFWNYAEKLFN